MGGQKVKLHPGDFSAEAGEPQHGEGRRWKQRWQLSRSLHTAGVPSHLVWHRAPFHQRREKTSSKPCTDPLPGNFSSLESLITPADECSPAETTITSCQHWLAWQPTVKPWWSRTALGWLKHHQQQLGGTESPGFIGNVVKLCNTVIQRDLSAPEDSAAVIECRLEMSGVQMRPPLLMEMTRTVPRPLKPHQQGSTAQARSSLGACILEALLIPWGCPTAALAALHPPQSPTLCQHPALLQDNNGHLTGQLILLQGLGCTTWRVCPQQGEGTAQQ